MRPLPVTKKAAMLEHIGARMRNPPTCAVETPCSNALARFTRHSSCDGESRYVAKIVRIGAGVFVYIAGFVMMAISSDANTIPSGEGRACVPRLLEHG